MNNEEDEYTVDLFWFQNPTQLIFGFYNILPGIS